MTSYMTAIGDTKAKQHSIFAFAGDAKTCAEIHVSTLAGTPNGESNLKLAVAEFNPKLGYQPTAQDYFLIATLLYKNSPALAAPYYKSSLDNLPPGPQSLTPRRVITDQLVMSLGMTGDIKTSRAVAQHAIEVDPTTHSTTTTSPAPTPKKAKPPTQSSIFSKPSTAKPTPSPASISPTPPKTTQS
jgi:hypothetical protein